MRSVWRSWGAILFAALTIGVDHGHAKQMDKDKHTVRMGELLVSAISIEDGPSNRISGPPHRIFGVHVRIQNVGKQFPCTTLKAYLVVKPFYEYPPSMLFEDQPSPNELLPGQTAQGQYTFDIRDGVVAKELLLKAEDSRESRCQEHPDWSSLWHYRSEARIPIEGLSAAEAQLRAGVVSQPKDVERPLGLKREPTSLAAMKQTREVHRQPGNTIATDDGFEYSVIDYGVGQVQIRSALSDENALSEPVLWIEFRITNASEHLLGIPRFSPSGHLASVVVDNWGNDYRPRRPLVEAVWSQATLPLPSRTLSRYKPQESTLDLAVIPVEELVKEIAELRVYLNRYPGERDWHFFSLHDPMVRRRNMLQGQIEPSTSQLAVEIGDEIEPPLLLQR